MLWKEEEEGRCEDEEMMVLKVTCKHACISLGLTIRVTR